MQPKLNLLVSSWGACTFIFIFIFAMQQKSSPREHMSGRAWRGGLGELGEVDDVGEGHDGGEVLVEEDGHGVRRQAVHGGVPAGAVPGRLDAVPAWLRQLALGSLPMRHSIDTSACVFGLEPSGEAASECARQVGRCAGLAVVSKQSCVS